MVTFHLLSSFLFLLPLATQAFDDATKEPDLNARLKLAATNVDKHSILASNEDWVFNFEDQDSWTFEPGSVVTANAATFAALQTVGMTISVLNLGPCAMLPPHLHQRATNLVIGVTGNTTSWMVNENGVRTVSAELKPWAMTIFPPGSLHQMQNNGCEDAQLISALNSEDTGTLNILNGLWSFPQDMVQAGFGDSNLDIQDMGKRIPATGTGAAMGSAECMKRCKIGNSRK